MHELFCQYNFIDILKVISRKKIKEIDMQIMQTLSALIENITNKVLIYYLLSNNFINNIICHNNFINYDNNYLITYVNFLKILSMRLNKTTLQFLFREDVNSFPLLENALKLYNHPDSLIRDEIKNIFLNILKIDYIPLSRYICHLPIVSYFCFMACEIKDKIILVSKYIQNIKNKKEYNENYKEILNEIIKSLIFIQKILDINCIKINYIIINTMFYYCIIPYIINNLNFNKKKKSNNCNNNNLLTKSISIFFINLLLIYIKNETFLNILLTLTFFPLRTNSINKFMLNAPIEPINYCYDWHSNIKKLPLNFFNYIQFNLSSSFLKSLLYMNNSKYIRIREIYGKYQKILNTEKNFDIEKNKEKILKELIQDVLSKLSCSEICIMTSYHNYLSIGTGVNCGLSTKSSNKCVMQKISKFYLKYFNKNNEEIKSKLIKNNIKNNFFEIILNQNGKKSDKKILLINLLLRNIFSKNKNISRLVLKESSIIPGDLLNDEEISYILNINKEKSLNNENQKLKSNESLNKKTNIYNNNSINSDNDNFIIEDKENNNLNEQFFETDIFKNTKVSNTLISIDGLINNSRNTITVKPKAKLKNIDNNGEETVKKEKDQFIINNKSIEVLLPKNKYSPFDNDYFNNIENNFNSFFYDNGSNKISIENYYNEELVNILIKLLDLNMNIGIITYKIIIDNILSLVTSKKFNNYGNNNINQCFISKEDKNKIYLIYEKYKNEIINNYNNKKSFHNNAYKLFINQYDKYILLNNIDYNNIIKEGYILLLNNKEISGNKKNIFLEIEKNENKNERNIILFILLHDFYYAINFYDNLYNNKNQKEQINNILYINNFPLIKRKGMELDKQYYLIEIDSNIKYFDSKCKIIKDKNEVNDNNTKEFFYCYILLYDNFLYIGDSSNNTSYTTIKYKFLISSCSILVDNYNNKNIVLYISKDLNKNNNIEIYLDFKDYNTSKTFKNIIEQEIKNSIFYEKGKIKQFIEQLK